MEGEVSSPLPPKRGMGLSSFFTHKISLQAILLAVFSLDILGILNIVYSPRNKKSLILIFDNSSRIRF